MTEDFEEKVLSHLDDLQRNVVNALRLLGLSLLALVLILVSSCATSRGVSPPGP